MRKRLFMAVAGLLMLFSLVACSSSGSGPEKQGGTSPEAESAENGGGEEKTKLVVWLWPVWDLKT